MLSLFFKAILGVPRVFHFESLDDVGFAILTGGKRVLGRSALGGLVRAASVRGVFALVKKTEARIPWSKILHISIDEHAIARFTRKFAIKKGYHTIRNKRMKVEKLFFSYCVRTHRLLSIIVTRGNARLSELSIQLLKRLRRRARGAQIRVILDAGAAENYSRLLELTRQRNQVTIVRTPRRPTYRKLWESIPKSAWTDLEEPGPYKKAPPKRISIAESRMKVAGTDVRTIVIRERARRGKDRWHALCVGVRRRAHARL
ncbi:MAG: hypothetical protein HY791_35410 [Deltaproteobacteria bacterium]|nr:hypothetical protein [Deltaproteobacteria bacterium]